MQATGPKISSCFRKSVLMLMNLHASWAVRQTRDQSWSYKKAAPVHKSNDDRMKLILTYLHLSERLRGLVPVWRRPPSSFAIWRYPVTWLHGAGSLVLLARQKMTKAKLFCRHTPYFFFSFFRAFSELPLPLHAPVNTTPKRQTARIKLEQQQRQQDKTTKTTIKTFW